MKQPTLWASSLIALASGAAAQTDNPDDTIIVTAQKLEERSLQTLKAPTFGVGIGEEQIAAVNAFNVEDSFKYAPNLIVRKRYIGDNNATLSFRGNHTTQTPRALVSVDGFTISNFLGASFDTAPKWGVLAPGDIDRVEIVYGPTSARYSGHSLGGTLLLSTREITENQARLTAQTFRGTYDYYDTDLKLDGYAIDGGLDFVIGERATLGVSYRYFENEGQPQQWRRVVGGSERQTLIDDGVVTPDYFDQAIVDDELTFLRIASEDSIVDVTEQQIRVRGTYDFGRGWKGRGLAALLIDEEETTNPRSFLVDENGEPSFIGVSGVRLGVSESTELLVGLGLAGELAGWSVDLAVSRFDVLDSEDRQSDNFDITTGLAPATGQVTIAEDVAWNSVEGVAERTFGRHAVAAGLSYAGYTFDTPRFNLTNWEVGTSGDLRDASGGDTRLYGVFVEDVITLSPQWTATLGLRAEAWEADDGFLINQGTRVNYASRSEEALSPKAALTYVPTDDWSFTASAALATRFPTVRELYQAPLIQFGPNVGDLDFGAFNPDLAPEEALDLQLTGTRYFDKAAVTVSLFRQDVDDTLFSQTVPELGTSVTTNIDEVRTDGIDVVVATQDWIIEGLAIDANVTFLDAEVRSNAINQDLEGNRFPRVPDIRANASVRYAPNENWLFAAGWRYQDTPDRNIENTSTSQCGTFFCVSNFSFVDLKATRRFQNFEISAGVDNVFDERAFVFHPYPGRTVLLSLGWTGGF
ncbi:MAG: TonB-dependent receptor [Pseudomonadota bacterium]